MGKSILNLRRHEDIQSAVRRRGREIAEKMTDKEIFTSREFHDYSRCLLDFLLRQHRLYNLKIVYDKKAGYIAYTDGKNITINTANDLASYPKSLEERFNVNMGVLFHETAHKLFLNFQDEEKAMKQLQGGLLYREITPGEPALISALEELKQCLQELSYRTFFCEIFANVANILDDGHDEAAMKRTFPGYITQCIQAAGNVQYETALPLEEVAQKANALSTYFTLLLQYAKFRCYRYDSIDESVEAYLTSMQQEFEPLIDRYLGSDRYAEHFEIQLEIVLRLWPIIREMLPPPGESQEQGDSQQSENESQGGNQSGGQSGSQGESQGQNGGQCENQGNSQGQSGGQGKNQSESQDGNQGQNQGKPSEEAIQQALAQLQEAISQAEASVKSAPRPKNNHSAPVSQQAIQSGKSDKAPMPETADRLIRDVAENKARTEIQNEMDEAMREALRRVNLPAEHSKVDLEVVHHHEATTPGVYDRILQEVQPAARAMAEQMLALLRELNEECVQHHRRYGPIVEAGESYRVDNRFFAKKKLPEDLPDMALALLIDQSGSMSGGRIETARKAAIMMNYFAARIGIPHMVAGHNTSPDSESGCVLHIYTRFDSAMESNDRRTLGDVDWYNACNRDGLAIRLVASELEKRPERIKLMIVLSDGLPNAKGYRGKNAMEDVKRAVQEYTKKGILIYGGAIGKDKEAIQSMYGRGYLDITELRKMPKMLVRLIRQQII